MNVLWNFLLHRRVVAFDFNQSWELGETSEETSSNRIVPLRQYRAVLHGHLLVPVLNMKK